MGRIVSLIQVEQFAQTFPFTGDPVVITNTDFDLFADSNGHYPANAEAEIVNQRRSKLRAQINRAASSTQWAANNTPFCIEVRQHGVDMVIRSAEVAVEHKARHMPDRIASLAKTLRRNVVRLVQRVDFDTLPVEHRLLVKNFDLLCDRLGSDIDYATAKAVQHAKQIESEIKALIALLPPAMGQTLIEDASEMVDEDEDEES